MPVTSKTPKIRVRFRAVFVSVEESLSEPGKVLELESFRVLCFLLILFSDPTLVSNSMVHTLP